MSSKHPTEIILHPVMSEKSIDLTGMNKYVFMVDERATKAEIKWAVKQLYGVDAIKVNIIKLPAKPKRWGVHRYRTKRRVKAVVTLEPGQNIPDITEAV